MTIHAPTSKTTKSRKAAAKKSSRPIPAPDTFRNGKRVTNLPTVFERLASRK